MGEFSDYFEDFPEENPANQNKQGQYDPKYRAERERLRAANEKLDEALRRKQPHSSGIPPVKPIENPVKSLPMHPHFAIIQTKLKELEALIEGCKVDDDDHDSYLAAIEDLTKGVEFHLEGIDYYKEDLPHHTEEELDAGLEIDRKEDELIRRSKERLIEIGYEPDDGEI